VKKKYDLHLGDDDSHSNSNKISEAHESKSSDDHDNNNNYGEQRIHNFENLARSIQLERENKKKLFDLDEEINEEEEEEKRLEAYRDLELTNTEFFAINLKTRYILTNPMLFPSIFNPRYKKLTLILTQWSIQMALIAILITANMTPNVSLDATTNALVSTDLGYLVAYAICAAFASNLIIYMFAGCFRVTTQQRHRLFRVVQSGNEMLILKEW